MNLKSFTLIGLLMGQAVFTQAQSGNGLDVSKGSEIGFVYESYMSPHQEPGEEKDTPAYIPKQFQSTKPSKLRSERQDKGYGRVSFTNDLSKAIVEVKLENVNIDEINMFHIHCGRPDQLGPILVDFALATELKGNFKDDGIFQVEITNSHIVAQSESGHGIIGEFTAGCPIVPGGKALVQTIAGMEYIAQQGELYFNLHTDGQTYFGDIRGRIIEASPETKAATQKALQNGIKAAPKSTGGHQH